METSIQEQPKRGKTDLVVEQKYAEAISKAEETPCAACKGQTLEFCKHCQGTGSEKERLNIAYFNFTKLRAEQGGCGGHCSCAEQSETT